MSDNLYMCTDCDFVTYRKHNYISHLATKKHLCVQEYLNMTNNSIYDCPCGKKYKTRSGLYKHKNLCDLTSDASDVIESVQETCVDTEPGVSTVGTVGTVDTACTVATTGITPLHMDIIYELLKQNNEFKELMAEQYKQSQELYKQSQEFQQQILEISKEGKTINNNQTNNFNMNLFLNEKCKDAVNIMDFVNSLQIKSDDLDVIGEIGYINGMTKVFMSGINELDVYKRPIHCSDLKRETLYIKDQNVWEKEKDNKPIIMNALKQVAHKNIKHLPTWIAENPACNDTTSKKNYEYLKMLGKLMGGDSKEEEDDKLFKVIKNIIREVVIKKEPTNQILSSY